MISYEDDYEEISLIRDLLATQPSDDDPDINADRVRYETAADDFSYAVSSRVRQAVIEGVDCEIHSPNGDTGGNVSVYLHGGGYVLGSARSHRHLVSEIARQASSTIIVPDYPRAPEAQFPFAMHRIAAVIMSISRNFPSCRVSLIGDSAGAGLALGAAQLLGKDVLSSIVCLSPWLDLTCSRSCYLPDFPSDGSLNPARLRSFARSYLAGSDPTNPLASPLFAPRDSFPPLLLQVGKDELFFEECREFDAAIRLAGRPIEFQPWDNVIHVWQWYWPLLDSGKRAIKIIAEFISGARKQ